MVLKQLEATHQVKFSYADNLIKNRSLAFKPPSDAILDIIPYLQRNTGLQFKLVSKNRYAIFYPKEKQNICGFLYDSGTKSSLGYASVTTLNSRYGTSTGVHGYFELNQVSPNDTLQMSILGYKTIKKAVSDFLFQDCLSIYLEEKATNLNEVIVRNYLTNSISKIIDGAIVFKQKSQSPIPGLTESDVLFTVQQIPGILNVDETASGLHVRGSTPDQNLVLYNGIKLYNTAHFFGAISAVNPSTVDKITVYKSASNVRYGNHIAGVVDIESASKIYKKTSGSLGSNLMGIDAHLNLPIASKLSLSISGRHSLTNVFDTPTIKNFSDRAFQYTIIEDNNQRVQTVDGDIDTDFYFYDYSARLNYQATDKDYFSLSLVAMNNNLNHGFSSTELEEKTQDDLELKNTGYSFQWQRQWSPKTNQKVYGSLSNYSLQVSNQKFLLGAASNYASIDKKNTVENIDIGVHVTHKFSKKSAATLGYQYSHYNVLANLSRSNKFLYKQEFFLEDNTNNTHTLFAEYQLKKDNDHAVNIGVRSNYFSLLDAFSFEPRLFAQTKVLPKLWLNSSFEMKQQNISKIIETFTKDFGLENEVWVLSNNEYVPLLKSRQVAIGAIFKHNSWLMDVDVFHRKTEGLTSITSGFETNRGFFVGEGTSIGLDLLLRKKWRNYNTWISYHTGKTTFTFDQFNNNKKFNGNYDVSHALYWSNNLKHKQFHFSLAWTYRVGVPFTSAFISDLFYIGRESANAQRLPNFHRLDISSRYNFFIHRQKNIRAEAGISILNLYNQKNILQRNYDVTDFDNPEGGTLLQEDIRSIGFTPNLSFRIRF
ncbi:MAG: TonB-dependent receptor [Flavobacteriaceae bacterium]|nr:TonB-dependent receptor [Flavobacteriaceae bacterium]